MGKMKEIIDEVKREKTPQALDAAICNQLEGIYQNIANEGNFRIHDNSGDGVLFSTGRDCVYDNGHAVMIGKNDRDLEGEEAFSRAIFNSQHLTINNTAVPIIAYESPLLRKKTKQNSVICKCDLVAYDKNKLYAVEYKKNWGSSTDIQYGLIESLIYGKILSKHIQENSDLVAQQILSTALNHRRSVTYDKDKEIIVSFVFCAPVSYYKESLKSARSQKVTREVEQLIFQYLTKDESVKLSFGGYVVYGDDNSDLHYTTIEQEGKEIQIPHLFCSNQSGPYWGATIDDVWNNIKALEK